MIPLDEQPIQFLSVPVGLVNLAKEIVAQATEPGEHLPTVFIFPPNVIEWWNRQQAAPAEGQQT